MMRPALVDSDFLAALEAMDLYIKRVMNGRFGGARRSPVYGSSPEFADYCEYAPGDDPRRIDWNLAARLDKYYVRQFVDERQMRDVIYIDLSASMGLNRTKADMTLALAAALGFLAVENMDQAGYRLLRGSTCEDLCGVLSGRESFYAAVQSLSELPFFGAGDLAAALRADTEPGGRNGLSVIISDFLTDSDWKSAVEELTARGRAVALVQVLSPEEASPMHAGRYMLYDAEDGSSMRMEVDRSAAAAYRQALRFFQEDIAAFCAARDIAFISARSDERIEHVILEKGYIAGLIR